MSELAKPVAAFLREYLPHERGASPHTIETYVIALRILITFLADLLRIQPSRLEIKHLDTKNVLAFLNHLEKDRKNGVKTRNMRLAAIKTFFRYLEYRYPEHLDIAARVRAIPSKKEDQPPVDYLSHEEVHAILDAPDTRTPIGLRDRAMLCLTYNAGLRVSELVSLPVDSLSQPGLNQIRVMGKGRRGRILPLWRETSAALHNWMGVRPDRTDCHLFLNTFGAGMTRRGFAKRLAVHAEAAAAVVPSIADKTVSPHSLRHACALHTLEATGDIRQVALWLGHASIQTTEMYLRIDPVTKLKTLSERQPPNLRKGSFHGVQDQLLAMLGKVGG